MDHLFGPDELSLMHPGNHTNGTTTTVPTTGCVTEAKYEWVMKDFGECVTTDLMMAGFILGLLSNLCWLVAQGPQMWKNYKNGSVEGLSFVFLAEWLAGDITNLIGCLLTQQVQTQLFTAIYFCVIDSMMVGQHMYYNPPWKKEKAGGGSKSVNAMLLPIICVAAMPLFVSAAYGGGGFGGLADGTATVVATGGGRGGFGTVGGMDVGVGAGAGYSAPAAAPLHHHSSSGGRVLLSYDDGAMPSRSSLSSTNIGGGGDPGGTEWYGPHTDPKWSWATKNGMIGYVCGWVSGILYFTSRIPQIRLNFKRKTCDGLNPVMFIMAVLGNMFYGCGVLMESVEVTFIVNHMPWLLGSVGTLIFDFTIIMQYLAYGTEVEQRKKRKRLISGSDRGRGGAPIYEDDDLLQHSDKLPLLHPSSP